MDEEIFLCVKTTTFEVPVEPEVNKAKAGSSIFRFGKFIFSILRLLTSS